MDVWSELDNYVKFPHCNCGSANAKLMTNWSRWWRKKRHINFLWDWML